MIPQVPMTSGSARVSRILFSSGLHCQMCWIVGAMVGDLGEGQSRRRMENEI